MRAPSSRVACRPAGVGYEMRPIGEDEFERFSRTGAMAFGEDPSPEHLEYVRRFFEVDRSLAIFDGGDLVATAGAFTFQLTVPGPAVVPAAGVTWVTVLPTHRRRGVLRQMMDRQLDDVAEREEPVALLTASEAMIYGRFGYGIGTRQNFVELRKEGLHLTSPPLAAGRVRLLEPDAAKKVIPGIYDQFRRSQPGAIDFNESWWESFFTDPEKFRDGASARYYAVHENEEGEADGYATYRISWGSWTPELPGSTLKLRQIVASNAETEAALFEFLLGVDLVWAIELSVRPVDDQLRWRLSDFRRYRVRRTNDWLWVRLVDIPTALAARTYATEDTITIGVEDGFRPANSGLYRLDGGPGGATCERVADATAEADLRMPVDVLGAAYLGGTSLATLASAGRVIGSPEAVARADMMFRSTPEPFCDRDF
jgi:predicted acetyltransferase